MPSSSIETLVGFDRLRALLEPYLLLSGLPGVRNFDWLVQRGRVRFSETRSVTHVLSILDAETRRDNHELLNSLPFACMNLLLEDNDDGNFSIVADQANGFILRAKEDNGCVLVHCGAGISRSAAIVLYHLCREDSTKSADDMLAWLKARRPIVQPNNWFMRQLQSWFPGSAPSS